MDLDYIPDHEHTKKELSLPVLPIQMEIITRMRSNPRYKLGRICFCRQILNLKRKLLLTTGTLWPMVAPVVFSSGFKVAFVAVWKVSCRALGRWSEQKGVMQ